jgi:tRNA nucleotidyltransferase/poly(A) polymerase
LPSLAATLQASGAEGWFVGGCLRDALLGRPLGDVDIAVTGAPRTLVHALPATMRRALVPLRHDTLRMVLDAADGRYVDISRLRGGSLVADLYARDFTLNALALPLARWPDLLALAAHSIQSDESQPATPPVLADLPGLIDPLGGLQDLCARRLRLAEPEALRADPGRILRAARFLALLDLVAVDETTAAARAAIPGLAVLPTERVREDLCALFAAPDAATGVRWLAEVGALDTLFPALRAAPSPRGIDPIAHFVAALDAVRPLALGKGCVGSWRVAPSLTHDFVDWAALPTLRARYAEALGAGHTRFVALCWGVLAHTLTAHDDVHGTDAMAGVIEAEDDGAHQVFQLPANVPGGEIGKVARSVARRWRGARLLLRADDATGLRGSALAPIRRYFAMAPGGADLGIDALVVAMACALAEAEQRAMDVAEAAALTARAREIIAAYLAEPILYAPPPLLAGHDLLRALPDVRGPEIGRILRAVRTAQLDGRIATRAEALALACTLTPVQAE